MDRLTNELVAIIADEVATSIRIVEAQIIAQRGLAGAGHAYSRGMIRGHEEALVELRRVQRRCDMVREALRTKAAVDRRVEAEGA